MRCFFIVVSVAVISFTAWCGFSHQSVETSTVNVLSTLLSFELIRLYGKNRQR